jgi:serine/threonine-protein kinase
MAPEQFEGRAVFASDLYSLGVTMYQMLTGSLPYDTPAPADLDRLRRGELVTPPRMRNPQIPGVIDDIVMKALAGSVSARYQRAEDLVSDLLRARSEVGARRPAAEAAVAADVAAAPRGRAVARPAAAPSRVRTREVAGGRFCWNCHKPLPARTATCPFCGETQ